MCKWKPPADYWKGVRHVRTDGTERQRDAVHAERQEAVSAPDAIGNAGAENAAQDRSEIARRLKEMLADKRVQIGWYEEDAIKTAISMLNSVPSAKEPRVSGIQLVKMMRDQRDALADAMRLIVQADDMEEHNEAIFKGQWKKGAKAWGGAFIDRTRKEGMKKARTALEGVPTSEQQLRNIAEGIGMTYEELMAAMSRPTESGAKA